MQSTACRNKHDTFGRFNEKFSFVFEQNFRARPKCKIFNIFNNIDWFILFFSFYLLSVWKRILLWYLWMQNTSFAVPGIDFGYPKKGIDVTKAKPKHDMIPTHHAPIHAGSPRSIVTSSSFMASKSTHRVNCSAPPIDKWMKLFESLWLTDISKNRTDSGSHSYQTK